MPKPIVVLVGRPNVGKSTLFNRLAEERLAVVDDIPGTTRDRLITESEWGGVKFDIIDTGGIDPTDKGVEGRLEPLSIGSKQFIKEIRTQAEIAIGQADAVIFLTDVNSGITPADQEVAQLLRKHQKMVDGKAIPPIFLAVNKADNNTKRSEAFQFYRLGLGDPYPISSLHGIGVGDLLDALIKEIEPIYEEEIEPTLKIAIIGKPNVGKSSLLNKLVGKERAIVSPIPGTTRDAIDTSMDFDGTPITLIDTAGIRRRGKIQPGVEKYSVLRSIRAIERSDVSLLMIDAVDGLTSQDAHIAGYILDAWKSVIVLVNKWDAIEKDTYTMIDFTQMIRSELKFLDYVPVIFISALTGKRVDKVLPEAIKVNEERLTKLTTSKFNRIIQNAIDHHPPPTKSGRQFSIYYGTQVRFDPPTFLLYVNNPKLAHFTYIRYLENQIRRSHPFSGTPIRLLLRPRR